MSIPYVHWSRFFTCMVCLTTLPAFSQSPQSRKAGIIADSLTIAKGEVTVVNIRIIGNKKTKSGIILREMALKKGDKVPMLDFQEKLIVSKNQVFNTSLFLDVAIYPTFPAPGQATLIVMVKERWYFFPIPYFKLADRNFNQWWVEEHRDLGRVNYGLKVSQHNLSGNNDDAKIWLVTGYSKQVILKYNLPFFEKTLKHGLNIGYSYGKQKELNYGSSKNKQVFYKSNQYLRESTRGEVSYSFRPDQRWRHFVTLGAQKDWIGDTILLINKNYFPDQKTEINYLDFNYTARYQKLDYVAYPTKGYSFEGSIYRRGAPQMTERLWQFGLTGLYVHPLPLKSFVRFSLAGVVKTPRNNPYINQRLLGYGDFYLRGQEYYVVDGSAGFLAKTTIGREIFKYVVKPPIKKNGYSEIPFRYFIKAFADFGYAKNRFAATDGLGNDLLTNKPLYSGGIGLDIVSIYDFVFRFELSFNQLGGNGLFLSAK